VADMSIFYPHDLRVPCCPKGIPDATSGTAFKGISTHSDSASTPGIHQTMDVSFLHLQYSQCLINSTSRPHCHQLLPMSQHRVGSAALGGALVGVSATEMVWVRLPSRKVKTPLGFFVANYLSLTGAGLGLVGELFAAFLRPVFSLCCLLTLLSSVLCTAKPSSFPTLFHPSQDATPPALSHGRVARTHPSRLR
jgi:hypothetical protein